MWLRKGFFLYIRWGWYPIKIRVKAKEIQNSKAAIAKGPDDFATFIVLPVFDVGAWEAENTYTLKVLEKPSLQHFAEKRGNAMWDARAAAHKTLMESLAAKV